MPCFVELSPVEPCGARSLAVPPERDEAVLGLRRVAVRDDGSAPGFPIVDRMRNTHAIGVRALPGALQPVRGEAPVADDANRRKVRPIDEEIAAGTDRTR